MAKTNFLVGICEHGDKEPLQVTDLTVTWCHKYTYLGSLFTADGSTTSAVKAHATSKIPHVLKFVSFIRKTTIHHSL